MIEIKHISKTFSQKNIFKDLSLQIFKGDSVAIIGQSGVGKSVLLKHINGLLSPDVGQVLIDKQNINKLSFTKKQEIRKKMSMVFQFGALFDSMTIKDNILLALNNLTTFNKKIKNDKVLEVLDLVNLKNVENYDYLILELSSFQLHYVKRLKLDIAAIVNNERRKQKDVARAADLTEVTIRSRYKEMAQFLNIDIHI